MESIQQYLVSASGQMSVPAAVRHRWHLDGGGPVDVIDLGFGVLTVPAGQAQCLLADLLSREDHRPSRLSARHQDSFDNTALARRSTMA
jgi:bifunctional DNA-binding transcriptional regulator/antitoxin component of YhaV-PrlF toxin-antitoxin module